jgi:hypothetical protein
VTRGRKLRVDTTAVETDIHFPTDSGLIGDGVRVVSRLLRRARAALGEAASGLKKAFRSRVRSVRKLSQELHRIARRKNEQGREALKAAYGRLVAVAKRTGAQGRRVLETLRGHGDDPEAKRLEEVLPRLKQGIVQAERRVIENDPVPSPDARSWKRVAARTRSTWPTTWPTKRSNSAGHLGCWRRTGGCLLRATSVWRRRRGSSRWRCRTWASRAG